MFPKLLTSFFPSGDRSPSTLRLSHRGLAGPQRGQSSQPRESGRHRLSTLQHHGYRNLGRTGLKVSELGFGAWGIGKSEWMGADDAESLRTLATARDLGINFSTPRWLTAPATASV